MMEEKAKKNGFGEILDEMDDPSGAGCAKALADFIEEGMRLSFEEAKQKALADERGKEDKEKNG